MVQWQNVFVSGSGKKGDQSEGSFFLTLVQRKEGIIHVG